VNDIIKVTSFFKAGESSPSTPWPSGEAMDSFEGLYVIPNTDPAKAQNTTSLTVIKKWKDNDDRNRPAGIQAQLYKDGEPVGAAVTLDSGNGWSHTWRRLDDAFIWTADEVAVPAGYTKTIMESATSYTITNTKTGGGDEPDDPAPKTTPETPAEPKTDPNTDDGDDDGDGGADGAEATVTTEEVAPVRPMPAPTSPGHSLVQDGDGWLELDGDGVPLGRWEWDPELEEWIFDEFTPLGALPATGYAGVPAHLAALAGLSLAALGALVQDATRRRGRHER
jgi:hypothetical protein